MALEVSTMGSAPAAENPIGLRRQIKATPTILPARLSRR